MPATSAEDQLRFLMCCVRNAGGAGKVDFVAVAEEMDIISKGAAAKRYERLFKAYNGPDTGTSSPARQPASARVPAKGSGRKASSTKKRKVDQFADDAQDNMVQDDEEDFMVIKKDEPDETKVFGGGEMKTEPDTFQAKDFDSDVTILPEFDGTVEADETNVVKNEAFPEEIGILKVEEAYQDNGLP